MCFYESYAFACGDWKWGNFRQHCHKEYRLGETCGMKMVFHTVALPERCKLCQKIDAKKRRLAKYKSDIARWLPERDAFKASIIKAAEEGRALEMEIEVLVKEKTDRYMMIGNTRR